MPSAPITFDLTGSVPDAYSMSFMQSGLSLTVSSALYDGSWLGTMLPYEFSTPTLSMTHQGIGALNTYGDYEEGFDADGKFEMATLSFNQTVQIISVTLIPLGDRFNPYGIDTQFVIFGEGLLRDYGSLQIIDSTDFTNDISATGSYMGIAAATHLDHFRIAAITVVALDAIPGLSSVADSYAMKSTDAPLKLNVLANDVNASLISGINTIGISGSVTLAADGLTLNYNAGTAFDYLSKGAQATETFTYTVLGTDGTSQTQTVSVTVTGAPNEITGTSASNALVGSDRHDLILGLGGNDTINGMGGYDEIDGGTGRDLLHGNDGHDLINGGDSDDYVYGDAGNDTVIGGLGNDRLYGGEGNDSLDGSVGTDRLYGDAGDDWLTGSDLANILDGGTGADTMTGGNGTDTYYVDDAGDQTIELAAGGTDLVYSTVGLTLAANVENVILLGSDAINATGNELGNRLTGNAANNIFSGLAGNDRLEGGFGNDRLSGGVGRDILTGGVGSDEFVFSEWGSANYDSIMDFNSVDDSILLSSAAMGHAVGGLSAAEFGFAVTNLFGITTFATTATQRIIYDKVHGDLYYDADGNGSGAKQLILSLVDGTVLTIADVFVF